MSPDSYDPTEVPRYWEDEHDDWWPEGTAAATPPEDEAEPRVPEGVGDGEVTGEAGGLPVPGALGHTGTRPRPGPSPRADEDVPLDGDEILGHLGAPLHPRRRRTRQRVRKQDAAGRARLDGRQRLLLLDAWLRSKLPAKDFAGLVGVSQHTLYKWKKVFQDEGPSGLMDKPKGGGRAAGKSRLPEATKRAIVMMKEAHPDWGQDRIHHMLARGDGFAASPGAIGRVLEAEGYVVEQAPTKKHPDKKRRFERARPNQLWQTDLFTFVLKREGRRVHLVAYMDDHSRFIVAWGLHASSSGALVREVFEAGVARFGVPEEVLTDNGSQYVTWRGKSGFTRLLERRGVKQVVSRPRHPQTLGKIERFWQTLWRECVESAIFRGIDEARERIGHFVDHYNFQRPHSGIDGHVPADRFFSASAEVRRTLEARVKANALDLAKNGEPRKAFYLTGRVGDAAISLHAEGERVVLVRDDGTREEVDLTATGRRADPLAREREVELESVESNDDEEEPPEAHALVPTVPEGPHDLDSAARADAGPSEAEDLSCSPPCPETRTTAFGRQSGDSRARP